MRVGCQDFVVRHAPIRQAQGRLSDGLRGGSPRTVSALTEGFVRTDRDERDGSGGGEGVGEGDGLLVDGVVGAAGEEVVEAEAGSRGRRAADGDVGDGGEV